MTKVSVALIATAALAGTFPGVCGVNNVNTHWQHHRGNFKKIICPFLSVMINEGALPVKKLYTQKELEDITEESGLHMDFVRSHSSANFENNPPGVQDIFNMEGASNEHITSTGIHDCPTAFTDCHIGLVHGEEICYTHTFLPYCDVPSVKAFDKFVAKTDLNGDGYVTVHELSRAVKKGDLPFVDANPYGKSSIFGSYEAIIRLFGTTSKKITVEDLHRVFILRRFPLNGYYFGRRPVEGDDNGGGSGSDDDNSGDRCFPGSAVVHGSTRGVIDLSDIRTGERILVENVYGDFTFEPVLAFLHEVHEGLHSHVTILLDDGELRASENHVVFVCNENGSMQSKAAGKLIVGEQLCAVRGRAQRRSAPVLSLRKNSATSGMFAPFTPSGKLVVDNAIASVYATSPFSAGVSHATMHAAMFAARLYYLLPAALSVEPAFLELSCSALQAMASRFSVG